jgi:hypothetical protein
MIFLSPYGVDDLDMNIIIRDKIAEFQLIQIE